MVVASAGWVVLFANLYYQRRLAEDNDDPTEDGAIEVLCVALGCMALQSLGLWYMLRRKEQEGTAAGAYALRLEHQAAVSTEAVKATEAKVASESRTVAELRVQLAAASEATQASVAQTASAQAAAQAAVQAAAQEATQKTKAAAAATFEAAMQKSADEADRDKAAALDACRTDAANALKHAVEASIKATREEMELEREEAISAAHAQAAALAANILSTEGGDCDDYWMQARDGGGSLLLTLKAAKARAVEVQDEYKHKLQAAISDSISDKAASAEEAATARQQVEELREEVIASRAATALAVDAAAAARAEMSALSEALKAERAWKTPDGQSPRPPAASSPVASSWSCGASKALKLTQAFQTGGRHQPQVGTVGGKVSEGSSSPDSHRAEEHPLGNSTPGGTSTTTAMSRAEAMQATSASPALTSPGATPAGGVTSGNAPSLQPPTSFRSPMAYTRQSPYSRIPVSASPGKHASSPGHPVPQGKIAFGSGHPSGRFSDFDDRASPLGAKSKSSHELVLDRLQAVKEASLARAKEHREKKMSSAMAAEAERLHVKAIRTVAAEMRMTSEAEMTAGAGAERRGAESPKAMAQAGDGSESRPYLPRRLTNGALARVVGGTSEAAIAAGEEGLSGGLPPRRLESGGTSADGEASLHSLVGALSALSSTAVLHAPPAVDVGR